MIDDMSNVFNGCKSDYIDLSKFNFRAIKNMFGMMYSCSNLKRVDLNSLENSVTNNLQGVFVNCKKLKEVDLSGLDTTNVIYANSMFENCISLETIRFDKFRVDKLISIVSIFKNCKKLTYIKWGANLDLSNIDCNSAFYGCENLFTLSISTLKLDSSKHKHCTDYMFYGCKKLADIGDVEYRNCRSAVSMFEGCKSLHKLTFRLWTWNININERRLDEQLVLCDNTFKDCSKLESVNFGNLCLIYQHHKGYSNDWEPVSLDFRDTFRGFKSLRKVTMCGYYEGLGFMDETINKIMLEKHKDDMRKHSKMGRRVEIHIK